MLVVSGFVWLMNGLRTNDAESQATDVASSKRTAAQAYRSAVEDAVGTVAVVTPGVPPAAFAEMGDTLQQMKQGTPPDDAADVFATASKDAAAAAAAITKYDVGTKIDDKGFDRHRDDRLHRLEPADRASAPALSARGGRGEGGSRVIGTRGRNSSPTSRKASSTTRRR